MVSSNPSNVNAFDEQMKTCSICIPTYLGRLLLRTHDENDTATRSDILESNSKKTSSFPSTTKWMGDDPKRNIEKQWTEEDFAHRVRVQKETRSNGKSCVLNIILLSSTSAENRDRCIGTTGYVTIDGETGYLGIITDPNTTRMGYATEALHTSILFGFEKLGLTKILMQTDQLNEEMREWCENIAGLQVNDKKPMEINGYFFTEYNYTFTLDQWKESIKDKLENKLRIINQTKSH